MEAKSDENDAQYRDRDTKIVYLRGEMGEESVRLVDQDDSA